MSANSQFLIKSTEDDSEIATVPVPTRPKALSTSLSPNGEYFTWGDPVEPRQNVIHVETGKKLKPIDTPTPTVAWFPNGKEFAIWTRYEQFGGERQIAPPALSIFNVETEEIRQGRITQAGSRAITGGRNIVHGPRLQGKVVWSPDGRRIISQGARILAVGFGLQTADRECTPTPK